MKPAEIISYLAFADPELDLTVLNTKLYRELVQRSKALTKIERMILKEKMENFNHGNSLD